MRFKVVLFVSVCVVLLNGIVFSHAESSLILQDSSVVNVNINKCRKSINDKNYSKAVDYAKKAVSADKNNSNAFYWLGMAYGMKARSASIFKNYHMKKSVKMHGLQL